MRKIRFWLGLAGLLVLLSACARSPQPTPQAETEQPTIPAASPSPVVTAAAQVDYCLECHTDKDRLIETAKPALEAVVESQGDG
ncbi:MAG: hypothetical protein AB1453_02250 [Chloroflexota bacterium]